MTRKPLQPKAATIAADPPIDGAPDAGNAPAPIRVSGAHFRNPVGKRVAAGPGGGAVKTALNAERANASLVINEALPSARAAFEHRIAADARTIYFCGTFADEVMSGAVSVPHAVLAEALGVYGDSEAVEVVAATKDYLAFRPGAGLLRIDIDAKRPDEVGALHPSPAFRLESIAEVRDAVHEMLPESRGCPMMVAASSGSMIEVAETGELLTGPGGWRVLIAVDDATRIPGILETIHLRCWSRERFSYAFVNRAGTGVYPRSLADLALARETQPDYPVADLEEGLRRADGAAAMLDVDGPSLDAASVVLADEDRERARIHIEEARAILNPAAARIAAAAVKAHTEVLVRRGMPKAAATRAALKRFESGTLVGSDVIVLDDGTEIEAALLLGPEGEIYDRRRCLDPVEPGYDGGRAVAIVYWNGGLHPGVNSFAHGQTFWRVAHDAETAAAAIAAAGSDHDLMALAVAHADVDAVALAGLEKMAAKALGLGAVRKGFRELVDSKRQLAHARAAEQAGGSRGRGARPSPGDGPAPLGEKLRLDSFPHVHVGVKGPKVLDHVDNIAHLLDSYGIAYRYNLVTREIDWHHPEIPRGGDNAETVFFSRMASLCAQNGVPALNLQTHLTALAARREYSPVVDYLAALTWDGVPRFDALAAALEPSDDKVARIVLRLFLIQAAAAADNAATARQIAPWYRPTFEGCLVLVGDQGAGKTKGLRQLLPPALRHFFKDGLTLDLRNKDSLGTAIRGWMTELGELEATFRKTEIAELKAFISRSVDETRLPYARGASKFARRTVFTGSVNDLEFLADETGNRRFWPLVVGAPRIDWSDGEIEQLWAEVWSRYTAGEQWWPTEEEESLLADNAERYRYRQPIEDAIEKHFRWGSPPDPNAARLRASDIYGTLGREAGVGPLTPAVLKTIGVTIARLWRRTSHAKRDNGEWKVAQGGELVRINSDDGGNRGWLLPPALTLEEQMSGQTAVDGGVGGVGEAARATDGESDAGGHDEGE